MKLQEVSRTCFAVLNEKNRVCDANSGLINAGGGMVIDTQSDLSHARRMIELFGKIWTEMPKRVVNTHEDGDHVWGNQLFRGAEIIGHRSLPERMRQVAEPAETQKLTRAAGGRLTGLLLKFLHPGVAAAGKQLNEDYDFEGIELVPPTRLFEDHLEFQMGDLEVHLIHVGPCHSVGDTIVWVPGERVLFAGDVIFRLCTPMGWVGTFENWFQSLDRIVDLDPAVIVPGHGPVCGVEGATEMKAYLEYVLAEARQCFDAGVTAYDAAQRIDLGPYADWVSPERIYLNVERSYRAFRGEPHDKPWNLPETFDTMYRVARARNLQPTF